MQPASIFMIVEFPVLTPTVWKTWPDGAFIEHTVEFAGSSKSAAESHGLSQ